MASKNKPGPPAQSKQSYDILFPGLLSNECLAERCLFVSRNLTKLILNFSVTVDIQYYFILVQVYSTVVRHLCNL